MSNKGLIKFYQNLLDEELAKSPPNLHQALRYINKILAAYKYTKDKDGEAEVRAKQQEIKAELEHSNQELAITNIKAIFQKIYKRIKQNPKFFSENPQIISAIQTLEVEILASNNKLTRNDKVTIAQECEILIKNLTNHLFTDKAKALERFESKVNPLLATSPRLRAAVSGLITAIAVTSVIALAIAAVVSTNPLLVLALPFEGQLGIGVSSALLIAGSSIYQGRAAFFSTRPKIETTAIVAAVQAQPRLNC